MRITRCCILGSSSGAGTSVRALTSARAGSEPDRCISMADTAWSAAVCATTDAAWGAATLGREPSDTRAGPDPLPQQRRHGGLLHRRTLRLCLPKCLSSCAAEGAAPGSVTAGEIGCGGATCTATRSALHQQQRRCCLH